MSYTQIRYDVEGPVALLTLHRPEKMNAFTRTMMAEIIDAMDEADGDDIHQAWGYRSLNEFAVTLTDRDQPDDHLALILERRGLFDWKLAAVDLQSAPAA